MNFELDLGQVLKPKSFKMTNIITLIQLNEVKLSQIT
jgi:hypothetical protein